jgi:uncharacterized protein involved in response to NO
MGAAEYIGFMDTQKVAPVVTIPLLRLGFRPMYWLGALFAALSLVGWISLYEGVLTASPALPAYDWHAHEMIFGFVQAVVVGFLFTASRNWTGIDTPIGARLAGIAGLWVAARVLIWTGPLWAAALTGAGFTLCAAGALWSVLYRARNRRNYFLVVLLLAFAVLDAAFFAAVLRAAPWSALAPVRLGVLLIVFLVTVIAGRVVPMFTQNATGAVVSRRPGVDRFALGCLLAAIATQLFPQPARWTAILWFAAAVAHAWRLAGWWSRSTLRMPILWILHLSYAWIPVGLVLFGLAQLGLFSPILAVHALTIGAIGGMIIGMITRTARGHTGRPLKAGPWEILAYALVPSAAVIRVGVPLIWPEGYRFSVVLSGVCWSLAFLIYVVVYTPILWRPRLDGKAG